MSCCCTAVPGPCCWDVLHHRLTPADNKASFGSPLFTSSVKMMTAPRRRATSGSEHRQVATGSSMLRWPPNARECIKSTAHRPPQMVAVLLYNTTTSASKRSWKGKPAQGQWLWLRHYPSCLAATMRAHKQVCATLYKRSWASPACHL